MALILYSRCCFEGFRHQGGQLPEVCPRCEQAVDEWLTYEELPGPSTPYLVTVNDVKFLRSLRIDPEWSPF